MSNSPVLDHFKRVWQAYLLLLLLLLPTFWVFGRARREAAERDTTRFRQAVMGMHQRIEDLSDRYVDVLEAVRAVLIAQPDLTPARWVSFLKGIDQARGRNGLRDVGLVALVPAADASSFEAIVKRFGLEGYRIQGREPKPERHPILYVNRVGTEELPWLGFDFAQFPWLDTALRRSVVEKVPVCTQVFDLPTPPKSPPVRGIVVFLPVSLPTEVTSSFGPGWPREWCVFVTIDPGMMARVVQPTSDPDASSIRLQAWDRSAEASTNNLVFQSHSSPDVVRKSERLVERFQASHYGRNWEFDFEATRGFYVPGSGWVSWLVLCAGCVLSGLAFLVGILLTNAKTQAQESERQLSVSQGELTEANHRLSASIDQVRESNSDLLKTNSLLWATLESTADGILVVDLSGRVTAANERFRKLWRVPDGLLKVGDDQQLLGFVLDQLADREGFIARVAVLYENPEIEGVDEVVFKDGRVFERYSRPQMLDGKCAGRVWSFRDVTPQRRAGAELKQAHEHLRSVIASSGDIILSVDPDGLIVEFNPAAEAAFGSPKSARAGTPVLALFADQSVAKLLAERTVREGSAADELELRRTSGETFRAEVRSARLSDGTAESSGWMCLARDVSARRRMESEMLRIGKLEIVGRLAGGLAHDFNNVLTAILGNVSLARSSISDPTALPAFLDEAERATQRARVLTKQLLTFSRGGAPLTRPEPMSNLLRDAAPFALKGCPAALELRIEPDLWPAMIDDGQIRQVIHNLVLNAGQAMPGGGKVLVDAHNRVVAEGEIPSLPPGRFVEISVSDDGPGIPDEHRERIFEPFFTTRARGSGMGLAAAASIVRQHGGYIAAESVPDRGALFRFLLPAASDVPPPPKVEVAPLKGRGAVLVMDDEEMIRRVCSLMLQRLGYEVALANDGQHAVQLYRDAIHRGNPFRAVILDLTVPGGMGGREALEQLKSIDPGVRAIVSSGYAQESVMAEYKEHGFAGVVAKPYRLQELGEALAQALPKAG